MTTTTAPPLTRRRDLMALVAAALCWMAVAVMSYAALPVYGFLAQASWAWPMVLVGIGPVEAAWLFAGLWSIFAAIYLGVRKSKVWAATVVPAAVLAGVAMATPDWNTAFVDSQYAVHRGDLAKIAATYREGGVRSSTILPADLRYLSVDGHAYLADGGVYLPTFVDFFGENAEGFGYFPTRPELTAGDINPAIPDPGIDAFRARYLGDGWWWLSGQ